MHVAHRLNYVRSNADEAAAALIHYHQDRMAVERGGVVADESLDTPRGAGRALAERLAGVPERAFLIELDDVLDAIREELLAAGRAAPTALLLCREIRQAARVEWAKLQQRVATG